MTTIELNLGLGTEEELKWLTERLRKHREGPKTVKRFKRPTIDEVRAYCRERGKGVDPEQWMDHYESNGWKVGKNSMKDWKAAVRTWERSSFGKKPEETRHQSHKPFSRESVKPASKETALRHLSMLGK